MDNSNQPDPTAPRPRRRPVRRPAKKRKAPAYVKGIQGQDPATVLKNATVEQIQALRTANFALWASQSGIEVDNHKFEFDSHRYLLPIYLDEAQELTMMKSAQMGATIYQLLRLLWYARHFNVKAGLYFPTSDGVEKLSKDRLAPLIRSNQDLLANVKEDANTLGLKQIANVHDRVSSLYMLYMGGKASKDSVPLDIVAFDEVRLIDQGEIDQALERISHSTFKVRIFMSTAGYPNQDIHKRFLRGTQNYWHVKCNCLDGFIPSDHFPDCIVEHRGEIYLRCPKCKMRIQDPQNGRYVAHNKEAEYPSYHISQLISRFITPKEIWDFYQTTTNTKEFFNAKLGKPFVDEENMPITIEVIENAVNPELRWAFQAGAGQDRRRHCAMGVDQMSGNNYVIIAKRGPDGRKELVHLEIIESGNTRYWEGGKPVSPFKRLYELMREFNVQMCVIDAMPNANEAQDFARAFPGRVFLAWYKDAGVDMVEWQDRLKLKESIRRGSKELKLKWQVKINRYLSIDYALKQWADHVVQMPDVRGLTQVCRNLDTGRYEVQEPANRLAKHLCSMVRQKTVIGEEEAMKIKMEWIYVDRDPHFTHSWNYCNVALERMRRQAIFTMA